MGHGLQASENARHCRYEGHPHPAVLRSVTVAGNEREKDGRRGSGKLHDRGETAAEEHAPYSHPSSLAAITYRAREGELHTSDPDLPGYHGGQCWCPFFVFHQGEKASEDSGPCCDFSPTKERTRTSLTAGRSQPSVSSFARTREGKIDAREQEREASEDEKKCTSSFSACGGAAERGRCKGRCAKQRGNLGSLDRVLRVLLLCCWLSKQHYEDETKSKNPH